MKFDLSTVNTLRVDNCREWVMLTASPSQVAEHLDMIGVLHTNNTAKFKTLWGKHIGTFDNGYRLKVWERQFKGETFYMFSANGYGTSYEIKCEWVDFPSKSTVIVEFMKDLYSTLKGMK